MEKARFDVLVNKVISVCINLFMKLTDLNVCCILRLDLLLNFTFIHVEGYSHLNLIFFFLEEKYCNLQNSLMKYQYTGTHQLIKSLWKRKMYFFLVLH